MKMYTQNIYIYIYIYIGPLVNSATTWFVTVLSIVNNKQPRLALLCIELSSILIYNNAVCTGRLVFLIF